MSYTVTELICPSCKESGLLALDTREMFISNGNAVLLCKWCGLEFLMQAGLKCRKPGCNNPVKHMFVSRYNNVPKPVDCFCDEHNRMGPFWALYYFFLLTAQRAVNYVADDITSKCPKCHLEVKCSNKVNRVRCSCCGKHFRRSVQLFGEDILEPGF